MRTYTQILDAMIEKYELSAGFTLHKSSDVYKKLEILSGEIYNCLVNTEWLKRQMFADTATGEYLDRHATTRGLKRREASKAFGEVTFSVSEPSLVNLTIPLGTVVATTGENPHLYETTEDATMRAGETSATVPVVSVSVGKECNAIEKAVTVMVTKPTGFETVVNKKAFAGGDDVESDESLRARILDSFQNASNGTNCAYYKNVALQVPGIFAAAVVPKGRGVGTVDVYIASKTGAVSDEQLSEAQALLSEAREVNVDVLVKKASPMPVSFYANIEVKSGYDFEEVSERCYQEAVDYISTRGAGGRFILTEVGNRIYNVEGVKEYYIPSQNNSNIICTSDKYPVADIVLFTEGIKR